MKKIFDQYVEELTGKSPESSGFAPDLLTQLRKYYDLGVGVQPVLSGEIPAHKVAGWLNLRLMNAYRIQLHGIGKDPFNKYYAHVDYYSWLKVEHYLIVHMYAIKKDASYIRNRTIAIGVGWLAKDEKDPDEIDRAERKVADALQIIKNDRMTFTVNQVYSHGKSGSAHVIRANWLEIIPLYSLYDPDQAFTIRMRKGVRYRIFSLVRETVRTFTEGLKKLLRMQRKKYLAGLITMDEIEFMAAKDIWRSLVQDAELEENYFTDLELIIPRYENLTLILDVKSKSAYNQILRVLNLLKRTMKQVYNRNLAVVPAYMF